MLKHKVFYRFHLALLFSLLFIPLGYVHAAEVTLTWNPNAESNLAGYKVYYGFESRNYPSSVDVGNSTSHTFSDLESGKTYYFAATAYNAEGKESAFSQEMSCSLGGKKLWLSLSPDRSGSLPLEGQTVSGHIYVFAVPNAGSSQVSFYLNDPSMTNAPLRVERHAPYDLALTATDGRALPFDTSQLPEGHNEITALINREGGATELVSAVFNVQGETSPNMPDLMLSTVPDRSNPVPLEGQTVSGNIYVFTTPDTGVSRVSFYVDDPTMSGSPHHVERYAPYDFAVTAADGTALPFNTGELPEGPHEITALVELVDGGSEWLSATFTVDSH